MKFAQLLAIVADEPVFETGLLLAGSVNPSDMRRQLVRWTQAGRLHQLRRGLYALAPPYRQIAPHPFHVANRLGARLLCKWSVGVGPRWCDSRVRAGSDQCDWWASTASPDAARPLFLSPPQDRSALLLSTRGVGTWPVGFCRRTGKGTARFDLSTAEWRCILPISDELRLDWGSLDLAELDRLAAIAARPKLLRAVRCIRALAEDETLGYEQL